jgi:hypothetical protein
MLTRIRISVGSLMRQPWRQPSEGIALYHSSTGGSSDYQGSGRPPNVERYA